DAGALQDIDIGAVVDAARRQFMPATMTRQEPDLKSVDLSKENIVRGQSPRTFDVPPLRFGQTRRILTAAAPEHTETRCRHALPQAGYSRGVNDICSIESK